MKKFALISQALLALALTPSISANPGFPTEYEGVMLQGFYWDSYEREFGIREALTADSQRDIDYQAIRPGRLVFNRFCLFPDYELPV